MTFKQLYDRIGKKLRFTSDRMIEQIKDAINEQITEFCRMKEWENIKEIYALTLDGSNSYDLDTNMLVNRCVVLEILDADGKKIDKFDYHYYKGLIDKSKKYAIMGNTLYLEGSTGDYDIIYTSFGGDTAPDLFPMDNNTDEISVTIHYWDIIKQMVVVFMLEDLGDTGTIELERNRLNGKLTMLARKENRERNSGKLHNVQRDIGVVS